MWLKSSSDKIGTLDYLIHVGDGIRVLGRRFLKNYVINVGDGINILGGILQKSIDFWGIEYIFFKKVEKYQLTTKVPSS